MPSLVRMLLGRDGCEVGKFAEAGMIDQNPWLSSGIGTKDGAGTFGDFNRGDLEPKYK